jgi:hypothetical protein
LLQDDFIKKNVEQKEISEDILLDIAGNLEDFKKSTTF